MAARRSPVASTTATVVPYRPAQLIATLPCQALRASAPVTVLATSSADGDGLIIDAGPDGAVLRAGDTRLDLETGAGAPGCHTTVSAGPRGLAVTAPDGKVTVVADAPVPKVFGFRTDLTSAQAAGIQISATVVTPFGTSPTPRRSCSSSRNWRPSPRRWRCSPRAPPPGSAAVAPSLLDRRRGDRRVRSVGGDRSAGRR